MSTATGWLEAWRERAVSLARAVWMCRASITVGLVMLPLLGKVPQGVDAVQGLSEDLSLKWPGFVAATIGCAWTLWYCARLGTYMHRWPDSTASRWTARLSGLFPCVGVMWGALNAAGAGAWSDKLGWIMVIAACACGLVVALSAIRRRVASGIARAPILTRQARALSDVVRPAYRRTHGRNTDRLQPAAWWLMMGLSLMAVVVLAMVTAWPSLAVDMGTVTLVLVAGMCYAAAGTALVWVDRRLPVPVLVVLVCWAGLLGWTGRTDNHAVRTLRPLAVTLPPVNKVLGAAGPVRLPSVRETFPRWLEDRQERWARRRGSEPARGDRLEETPVVLVCAEGGGIYAAYHTALVLALIQDRAPGFAEHVFAISGVSGGSVGASLWVASLDAQRRKVGIWRPGPGEKGAAEGLSGQEAALMSMGPAAPNAQKIADALKTVLGEDLLSRVLAYGLGADMLQAGVPVRMAWADRARQLEESMEAAARGPLGLAFLESSFYDLWPGFTGLGRDEPSLPYLFLNTTSVETGGRVMVSPLSLRAGVDAGPRTLAEYTPDWNVALSTAAVLSARFPYVTPAGLFERTFHPEGCPAGEGRLADGGYFDNAGATTLDEILQEIESQRDGVGPFRVLVLRIGAVPTARAYYTRATWPDLLSPPRTMLNTRGARGREALDALKARVQACWRSASDPRREYIWSEALLDTDADAIPLGWVLSSRTQKAILAQLGEGKASSTRTPTVGTPAYIDEFVGFFEGGNTQPNGGGN